MNTNEELKPCHILKTDPAVFQAVFEGRKTFEIRKDDRTPAFADGDTILLRETQHTGAEMAGGMPLIYTGREIAAKAQYILRGPIYGLAEGWCIMSIDTTATSDAAARIAELEQNLASFHRQHGAQATEMQKLQRQVAQAQRERDAAKADTERIANNFVEVQRLYSSTDSHNCELRRIITGVRSELRTVKAEADQLRAELEAVKRERDEAVLSTNRQAHCIHSCAANIGPDTSITLEGLPFAVKRVMADLAAARQRIEVLEGRILDYCERNGCMRGALMEALRANIALPFGLRKQFEKALSTQSESEAKHARQDGVALITAERQRQISKEGWTPEHDDGHEGGDLIDAALCYAAVASAETRGSCAEEWPVSMFNGLNDSLIQWPWEGCWWKPSDDPVRNLTKAGALIAAEIDRLQRMQSEATKGGWEKPFTWQSMRNSDGVDGYRCAACNHWTTVAERKPCECAPEPTPEQGGGE